MSTKALIPGNSQRARLTALNAFERFAVSEKMIVKQVRSFIEADNSGDALYMILDKFGMYLAFQETSRGSLLSKNSVASYFGNVKNHLLELYPGLHQATSRRLQKVASILDKHCAKRGTEFTHQAPPCRKADLLALVTAIYKGATKADDYKDAGLLNLLWYLLGRSSDTSCLVKSQLAVYPGGCLFIQFKRMKSASYQGASLFYDFGNCATCPVHALAVATIMQTVPTQFLLDQLPRDAGPVEASRVEGRPLVELLAREEGASATQDTETTSAMPKAAAPVPGMQAYVNRLLKKWSGECSAAGTELTQGLSSHSFRRGAAQSANSDTSVNTPWIMDRGGWSMTSVSKAFNYIVSTTQDDQQLGKILAGWGPKAKPYLLTLQSFDRVVSRKIRQLQDTLFETAFEFPHQMNLRDDVLEVLMAVVLRHYGDMLKLSPDSPYIAHMKRAQDQHDITESEISSWALTIQGDLIEHSRSPAPVDPAPAPSVDGVVEKQSALIQQQMDLIGRLSSQVQDLTQRVTSLEGPGTNSQKASATSSPPQLTSPTRTAIAAPRRRSHAKPLSAVWYEWFTSLPWKQTSDRRRYHEVKVTIAFMRIFLPQGYDVTGSGSAARARILKAGQDAEKSVLLFLKGRQEKTKAYGTVVKCLKRLYANGDLNELIVQYQARRLAGSITDDTPAASVHDLQPQRIQNSA